MKLGCRGGSACRRRICEGLLSVLELRLHVIYRSTPCDGVRETNNAGDRATEWSSARKLNAQLMISWKISSRVIEFAVCPTLPVRVAL